MRKGDFDVVVIGAGFGGMCAAARLAHRGYKTLVVERLSLLGGRCSTIVNEGFKITTGAVAIVGGGVIEETFREVGAEFNVRRFDPVTIYLIEGKYYAWPLGESLARALYEFGRDKDGVNRILEAMARAVAWQLPAGNISVKEWLSQYTEDEHIYQVFQPMCTVMLGENIHGFPISELFKFMTSGQPAQGTATWNYAVNGNIDLIQSLGRAIEEKGGEIWKNAEAKRIIVDQHKVTGVVVETSEGEWEISAKAVVSNLGPKRTVEITGREHFDRAYLRALELVQPTSLIVASYVISDHPLIEYPGVVCPIGSPNMVCHLSPTLTCPELAPEGKHFLYSCSGITEPRTSPIDIKSEIKLHLEELNRLIPDVEKRGKVLSVQCFQGDWPLYRSMWHTLPQRTPVVDLYNVGDGVRISGLIGVDLCAETARIVSEDIMSRIEPTG